MISNTLPSSVVAIYEGGIGLPGIGGLILELLPIVVILNSYFYFLIDGFLNLGSDCS